VSVFQNIGYRFGISVYRLTTGAYCPAETILMCIEYIKPKATAADQALDFSERFWKRLPARNSNNYTILKSGFCMEMWECARSIRAITSYATGWRREPVCLKCEVCCYFNYTRYYGTEWIQNVLLVILQGRISCRTTIKVAYTGTM